MTNPATSDDPAGDLTEHGVDPEARRQDGEDGGDGASTLPHDDDAPAGDLTDHGVDPPARARDEH